MAVPKYRLERNNTGIFTTAFRYNIENIDEAELFGDLYFDLDNKDDFEAVREDAITILAYLKTVFRINYEETYIYFSGKKGIHLIIPSSVLGIAPNKKLNVIFKSIAFKLKSFTKKGTLDMVVYDNKRMLRIPYSVHEDTKLYKIELSYDELRNLSHDEIKELAKTPRKTNINHPKSLNKPAQQQYIWFTENYEDILEVKVKKNNRKNTLKVTPPCIQSLIDDGVTEGSRNNCIAILSSFYKNCGKSYEEALELVSEWNDTRVSPSLKPNEVKRTIVSIYNGQASYGCSALKNLNLCDESKCSLKRKG